MRSVGAVLCAVAAAAVEDFTIYTEPIALLPGQVHNRPVKPVPLPGWVVRKYARQPMGIVKFQLDIVAADGAGTSSERRVPLYEIYNHHSLQAMGTMKNMQQQYKDWTGSDPLGPHTGVRRPAPHCGSVKGSATPGETWNGVIGGAEYRDADRDLPAPYRAVVDQPEAFIGLLHFINIQSQGTDPADYARLFECPCTSHRDVNATNGTVDGVVPLAFDCNAELLRQKNPDCTLDNYVGGYRCCEDGVFVSENPDMNAVKDVVVAKFTFRVDDVVPETRHAYATSFDCTGNETAGGGNAEYSVPACDAAGGVPPDQCVHVVTGVVPILPYGVPGYPGSAEVVEFLTMRGHQHVAGLGMEMFNERTGQLICRSVPEHGKGAAAGDEEGYIVGVPPCVWGPPPLQAPPRLRVDDKVRIVSRYNSTVGHHGVMCFFFGQVSLLGYPPKTIA